MNVRTVELMNEQTNERKNERSNKLLTLKMVPSFSVHSLLATRFHGTLNTCRSLSSHCNPGMRPLLMLCFNQGIMRCLLAPHTGVLTSPKLPSLLKQKILKLYFSKKQQQQRYVYYSTSVSWV